ncbi:NADH dehydrogenase [ubiquinone] flavoprotein 3, mitochondrial isoform X1 [Cavia porcellus]|uniref:NADH dehydrogenase [ubiquinone] flavoprotein 3, mitochondrial isoform X1 n=1 Tax=Cavia porcellus TaxID=10141 RepID=UPI00022B670F|nr:NADH dehydrogenase [ubiquinone] flavoprotein 3, mitochondrial isoform X1 [Cavia porcellus]
MAVRLLLRRGPAEALKTVLLEVPVFRGPASTVSRSAQSGKNEKELPANPRKQSPPKNVEEPKERGKLLTTYPEAAAPPSSSPRASSPAPGSRSRVAAGTKLFTEEGLSKALATKTLVVFPQKVPAPLRAQGGGAEAHQDTHKVTDESSSSSSSSSESESDEERDVLEAGPREGRKSQGGSPSPEATRPSENRTPRVTASAKEKSKGQKPHADVTTPERASQLEKKRKSPTKPLEGREEAIPERITPRSQAEGAVLKQGAKEKKSQKTRRPNELVKESPEPPGAEGISLDRAEAKLSTQAGGNPFPAPGTQKVAGPGPQVPQPGRRPAPPCAQQEIAGKQVGGGHSEAKQETPEDQGTLRSLKPAPVQKEEAQTTGLKPTEGAAPPLEALGDTQESAEPYDNTTYKNLQHHDYNTYTFLDLNLNLSKFRLPQPSSGRESPRH